MPEQLKDIGTILFALFALIGVLVLAYFTTRWLSNSSVSKRAKGIIKIIDRQPIAQDKSLLIVRVGDKRILLVGVSSQNITKLAELDEDDTAVSDLPPEHDFATALKSALSRRLRGSNWGSEGSHDERSDGRDGDK